MTSYYIVIFSVSYQYNKLNKKSANIIDGHKASLFFNLGLDF